MRIPDDIRAADEAGRIPAGLSLEYLAESLDRPTIIAIIFMIYIAFTGMSIYNIRIGTGRHIEYVQHVLDLSTVRYSEELDLVAHILYSTALYTARLSGVAFYQRVAAKPSLLHTIIIWAYPVLTVAFLTQLFLLIFHCTPVTSKWPFAWQPETIDYHCIPWGVVYLANSGLSLACDMLIFVIPGVLIHQLHTNKQRKFQLALVMFPGLFVLVLSAVRVWLVDVGQFDRDQSWRYDPMMAVESAEIAGTLIALSAPGLKPLLGLIYHGVPSSAGHSRAKSWQQKAGETPVGKLPAHGARTEGQWKILGGHNDTFDIILSEANVSSGHAGYGGAKDFAALSSSNIRITDEFHVASEYSDSFPHPRKAPGGNPSYV
ncbi:hypothetical protein KEM54_003840 [Ascosphaera aggregata]|nr:hypothetical protein KEM54_003840 [Ascosphaera aggregata]